MSVCGDKVTSRGFGGKFLNVSVTGSKCSMMCSHCRGKYLEGMASVDNPEELWDLAFRLQSSGGNGLLVSGGCDGDRKVPLREYLPVIREISDLGLKVNLHPGVMTEEDADMFSGMNVCLSVDVHQDPEVIRNVFGLKGPDVYRDTLDIALATGCNVVPHLTVGFSEEDLKESACIVKEKGIENVVLLSLVPTEGTAFEDSKVTEDEVIDAVRFLIGMGFNVTLGCMRDRRMRNLEKRAIKEGVRKIANLSLETQRWAESEGYEVSREEMCCCFSE